MLITYFTESLSDGIILNINIYENTILMQYYSC